MRQTFHHFSIVLALLLAVSPRLASAWPPGGVVVAPVPDRGQNEPHLLLGKHGTPFAYWSDGRWLDGSADLYAQLLTSSGQIALGWPDTGLMVARAFEDQRALSGLSHPDGSFILGILDYRNSVVGGTGADTYVARVLPDGSTDPTWPRHGFQATARYGVEGARRMIWVAPDTFVTCTGFTEPQGPFFPKFQFQSVAITPSGPVALWGPEGLVYQWRPNPLLTTAEVAPDGTGGLFAVFDEYHSSLIGPEEPPNGDLYVMRLGRDGQPAAGWETGAKPICVAPGYQELAVCCPDGAGGVFVAWVDARSGAGLPYPYYLDAEDIRLLRLTAEGTPHPGWPSDGLVVSDAPGWQYMPAILPDGAGGVYVSWDDVTIGVTRVRGDGTFAPGWSEDGIQISDLAGYCSHSKLASDGAGGAYVLFDNLSEGVTLLQRVRSTGGVDPLWPSAGVQVSANDTGSDIVSDGEGGCYVTYITQLIPFGPGLVAVNRYGMDGVVPVKLAEATVEVEPGRVHLAWHGVEAAGADLTVQRRGDDSDAWRILGAPRVGGRDRVEYDDESVAPGARYAYRLTRGAEVLSEEQWVDLPGAVFALAGIRPNPAPARELTVEFTLAGAGRATLEVLDLAGRREHTRTLDALTPGRHVLSLADAGLAPGIHWLRLHEGARVAHARFVVVR